MRQIFLAALMAALLCLGNAGYVYADSSEAGTVPAETEPETREENDGSLVWNDGHAEMVTSGGLVAEHFLPDEETESGTGTSSSGSASSSGKGMRSSTRSRTQLIQELRDVFSEAFKNCDSTVDLSGYGLTVKDSSDEDAEDGEDIVTEAYQTAVTGDDFYITGDFRFGYDGDSGQIMSVSIGYGSSFREDPSDTDGELPAPDKAAIEAARTKFDAAVKDALEQADKGSSDLEKLLLIHDYIVTQCTYDYGNNKANGYYPDDDYTAYGVLVNHTAVCNGYAFAFSWLAQQEGIETYIVASDSMDHAWNLVKLGGSWYHVDTARDDRIFNSGTTYFSLKNADAADEGYVSHRYFLRSDSEMKNFSYRDWTVQASSEEVPEADASGSYEGYLFRMYPDGAFALINGKWYLGSLEKRTIYESPTLLSSDAKAVYSADDMMYAVSGGDTIYFNRKGGVYAYDPASGSVKAVWLATGENQTVSELGVKDGKLVYIVLEADGSTTRVETALSDVSAQEIPASQAISSTTSGKESEKISDGWVTLSDGSKQYFSGGKAVTGKKKINGSWYYFDGTTAKMKTGWVTISGNRYYFDRSTGQAYTGWHVINKKGYYFAKKSAKAYRGWHKIGGRKYYFNKKGVLKKSPGKVLTGGYFFDKKGTPAGGWKKIGGKKYYFKKSSCRQLTGLHRIGKYTYYLYKNGGYATGFKTINGKRYYFRENGRLDT